MKSMALKVTLTSFLAGLILVGFFVGLFMVSANLFWALVWFLLINSFLRSLEWRIAPSRHVWLYILAAIVSALWIFINSTAYRLIAENINTNPYGDYVISQLQFRLSLSLFVLKAISAAWLTDTRLAIVATLVLARWITFRPLFRFTVRHISQGYFEFTVHTLQTVAQELMTLLGTRFALVLINTLLWCTASFLLRFDNFIILTAIMGLCMITPVWGLWIAAALSAVFVESGLFLLQFGGLFIATVSIWFIDYTVLQHQETQSGIDMAISLVLPILGYLFFSFAGLFVGGPLALISFAIGRRLVENLPLIHRFPKVDLNASARA